MQKHSRIVLVVILAVVTSIALALLYIATTPSSQITSITARPTMTPPRFMFNVTLHTAEELRGMLGRAEELAARQTHPATESGIALVLHGPEIKLFTKQTYGSNKTLVDLAERLDRNGVIEVTMCQTAMRALGVKEEDVPSFISFVPYAPDEIKRLESTGYVYL